jgi:Domain of unknown function (DUF4170)
MTLCAVDRRQPGQSLEKLSEPLFRRRQSSMSQATSSPNSKPQLLHLVFGGELKSLDSHEFHDTEGLDVVGIFPDYQSAYAAWKNAAQRSVDNAMVRYFIVHLHRLLEPTAPQTTSAA